MIFVFFLIGLLIWGRFFYLTIIRHDYYLAKAKIININNNVFPRGSIFLTDKNELPYAVASNKEFPLVYASPIKIKNPRDLAKKLAPILELDKELLFQKLSKPNDSYEVLKRKISDETISAIKSLKEDGIGIDNETLRYYPEGLFLAQVIGFLGFDKNGQAGQYGLEEYYDKELSDAVSSADLILTIDSAIQAQAGILLADLVKTMAG